MSLWSNSCAMKMISSLKPNPLSNSQGSAWVYEYKHSTMRSIFSKKGSWHWLLGVTNEGNLLSTICYLESQMRATYYRVTLPSLSTLKAVNCEKAEYPSRALP